MAVCYRTILLPDEKRIGKYSLYFKKNIVYKYITMPRKTKSGKEDKRSTTSANNAAKARQKLSSYVAKGKKMREEVEESEDDFDIRDSDFDSEPEPEPVKDEPEPEKNTLEPEKNTFKSVRQLQPPEPEPEPEPKPKYEPVQQFENFQKQKYISMSQMLRKSILRY